MERWIDQVQCCQLKGHAIPPWETSNFILNMHWWLWNFSKLKTLVKLKSYFFWSLIILSSEIDTQVCDVAKGPLVCSCRMVIYWYIVFNYLIHMVVFIDNFWLCRDRWWWGLWCKTQRATIFSHQWRSEEVFKRCLLDYVTIWEFLKMKCHHSM